MPVNKRLAPRQWVQVGGGEIYEQGTPAYQEGGWSPLWAVASQGASSLGKELACKAAKRFRQTVCRAPAHDEEGEPVAKKKKKKHHPQKGGLGVTAGVVKGLGNIAYKSARAGAGALLKSKLARKKALEFITPMVGESLNKLGDKVGGLDQLGAGSHTYSQGTDPYQEGGILPLLGLATLIPGLAQQFGAGSHTYSQGTDPYQEGGMLSLLGLQALLPHLNKQLGAGRSQRRNNKRKKSAKVITGSSLLGSPTLRGMFRRQGGRSVGVLPEYIPGPQVGLGRQPRRRSQRHCFQGLP